MANDVKAYDYSKLPMTIKITNAIQLEVQGTDGDTIANPKYMADDAGNRGIKEVIAYDDLKEGEKYDFLLDQDGNFVKDEDKIQVVVTRKYKNTARVVQFYKTNDFIALNPGDSVTVEARTSSAASYYFSLAGSEFTVEAVEAAGDESQGE